MIELSLGDPRRERFVEVAAGGLEPLRAFVRRRVAADPDADDLVDDLVQETLARAWCGLPGLRDASRMRPWLYRILRAVVSDYRAGQRREETLARGAPAGEPADPTDALFASLAVSEVGEALRALPGALALAVRLHDLEGYRYREIAELTHVPLGTVMSRIARGRRRLALLERDGAQRVVAHQ